MGDLAAVRLADRVLNARRFQIECMVARERQQIKSESVQSVERFRWREKPTALCDDLAFFRDGRLKIREHHVSLQQSLNNGHLRRRRRANIRPDHGLARQGYRHGVRLRLRRSTGRARNHREHRETRRSRRQSPHPRY